MQDGKKKSGRQARSVEPAIRSPLDPLRRFVVFLETFAPLVNSVNLGISSPLLLGPLQLAHIKTQLALHQLNSVASQHCIVSYALLNEAFLKIAMYNPRGNMHQNPRGPNTADPREPFQGPRQVNQGQPPNNQGQPPSGPRHGMPQQFMRREMGTGFSKPDVRITQRRMDPRQAREQRNQKEGVRVSRWEKEPFPQGNTSQNQPASGSLADHNTNVPNRYTNESASSILASFGLSNEDLEELSRYPDDQLTPENMPLILREIRMRKISCQLPVLPAQSREKETFHSDNGRGSVIKSKVIDYGHESKYGYSEGPLEVKVYDSDVATEKSMKGFQAQQTASVPTVPSGVANNPINAVEELIRQMGFQRSSPNPQTFFAMDTANKMPGLCLPSAPAALIAVPPMMPPMMLPMHPPVMPPVQQPLPPPPVAQPMMPAMNQPPPPFAPGMLETLNRNNRNQQGSRVKPPTGPPGPTGGQKNFQKMAEKPIESPFGVVKASWLPVFSQADAQKLKRLPTPSMMNDYYAASPRIFPHMCSLCNVECRHLKDWIQHQNATAHIENCRQLRQQYPDWNPEAHSSSKRRESERQESHTSRRRSAGPSPKRSRRSSSGPARRRSRSRSPGYHRTTRPRSRSPKRLPSPRRRSRSPWRPLHSSAQSPRPSSKEKESGRFTKSTDEALEAVVKCLGPRFVEQFNKQKSLQGVGRGTLGPRRMPPEPGNTPGNAKNMSGLTVPQWTSKRDSLSHHGPSDIKTKAAGMSNKGGLDVEDKNKKLPLGAPAKEISIADPAPYNRLLSDKLLSCGTVLHISNLPDDGYSDRDIEKIVQPFGKVSDILVLRSRNEAFLEMNYKEAVIAAVKYGETVPVLVNGRRVKISIAEKPKAPPSQLQKKGNEKQAAQNIKKPPLNTKKDQINPAAKMPSPMTSTSKTNEKKPGEPQKVGEMKTAVEQKKAENLTKSRVTNASMEQKKPADPKKSEETKKTLVTNKSADPKKTTDSGKITDPKKIADSSMITGPKKLVDSGTIIDPKKMAESGTVAGPKKTAESGTVAGPKKMAESSTIAGPKKTAESSTIAGPKKTTDSAVVAGPKKTADSNTIAGPKKTADSGIIAGPKKTTDSGTIAGPKKTADSVKITDPKKTADSIKITDPKKTADSGKIPDPKKTADSVKITDPKKTADSVKITDPKKTTDSKAKETNNRIDVPGTVEAVQSTEAGDSGIQEAEDTCVVVISNLPEAGLTLDEIFNLTKPFGGMKDVLILPSHKKAYIEISQKSADSLVKFYTCFPMWVEMNKLCISMASEFKDIKDEEAIFIAMIKDANPKVNVEALHAQFVHLGNLPDGGYSELEILCVGLRFGRVDHYVVISNKNKAILQLDSAESAASMCRFLKRYPYSLGESQLTFYRSPKIEPLQPEVTKKEVKKQEPSKESPDLKKNPEGSGLVHTVVVSSAKPTEAKEEPSSKLKTAMEVKTEHSEKMESEVASEPSRTVMLEGELAASATTLDDLSSSEVKSEKVFALPCDLGNKEKVTDKSNAELLGNALTSRAGNKDEEPADPTGELSGPSSSTAKMEGTGAGPSKMEKSVETAPAIFETVPLDSTEAPVEELSAGDLQSSSGLVSPGIDPSSASRKLPEMSAPEEGVMEDKEPKNSLSTAEGTMKAEPEATGPEIMEPAKEKPELQMVKVEAASENQAGMLVSNEDLAQEQKSKKKADDDSREVTLAKSQPSKGIGQTQSDESSKAAALAAESATSAEATSVSRTILKALMSVPNISKARTTTRRKEEKKLALKTGTQSGTVAEKKLVPKEPSQQRPTNSRSHLPDSKCKPSPSSLVFKVGIGKSSSQQEKVSQVESKGSSKQTQEQENRSSSAKRDSSKEKVFTGRTTRSSSSSVKPKEEEELFPFNLDEFVTVDEVTDEADSPAQPRRNPPRSKRKDTSYEPVSKRRKGKNSVARGAAESELSFVTLDEIGGDEGGMAPMAEHLEAMPDPKVLVTVDELNDEEELISEVTQDPQSLVTLDEISEQEDPAVHETAKEADSVPDLKAEPLVTVDEIGEVEELPLNEPSHFKTVETLNDRQEEKEAFEDSGDLLSSQVPEDPSTLVTVDEIHEDSDDQPLVTLDEVAEEEDDFLADFNNMEGELNFVTVDEVGSEDDEEEKVTVTSTDLEESVATTGPEKETAAAVTEPTEDLLSAAKQGETVVLDDTSPGEKACAGEDLPEENKATEAQVEAAEKEAVAAETDVQEAVLVETEKGEEGKDLEQALKEETEAEAEAQCEQPSAESTVNLTEGDAEDRQQPSESETPEKDLEAKAMETDVVGCSEPAPREEQTGKPSALEASVGESQTRRNEDTEAGAERLGQDPDCKQESGREGTASQSLEKPEKELAGSECEEQEPERKIDLSEKSKAPDNVEDLDFLVPRAGFFCQICSCFCVDEASMKTHCQSPLHQQNKKKFMNQKAEEEEKKEAEGDAEGESLR
ncbi:zinc finger protein 638-like isoform X2 [Eublepharis macularius]|uniref:Zinc finger protein 638-like isoform X2 n=1 Tax=Eublepharis macularius TaxID=481883 RepID=A0AA97L8C6_EUBMA|nr:zinc finger protein 638-like isoform X2 [Eublepharis macularius]